MDWPVNGKVNCCTGLITCSRGLKWQGWTEAIGKPCLQRMFTTHEELL